MDRATVPDPNGNAESEELTKGYWHTKIDGMYFGTSGRTQRSSVRAARRAARRHARWARKHNRWLDERAAA